MASPSDNFLLFGANCKETHEVVVKFCKFLAEQCQAIEEKTYSFGGMGVKFSFELVPSDMKFLAFINGELSNSATYFSSFANVSTSDLSCVQGKFGKTLDCKWKPWGYNARVDVACKVSQFKAKLSDKLTPITQRKKVTQFIANLKSRQEFKPLIGPLCEKAVLEPLHLKNNAVQKLYNQLLKLALANSNLAPNISSLTDIHECSMRRFLVALEVDVKAIRLKKQLVKWLFEERTHDKSFTYRFTGKDSRLVLLGFMHLVIAIRGNSTDVKLITKLLIFVFVALRLQKSISLFSMYHFSEEKVEKLFVATSEYWSAFVSFWLFTFPK